MRTTTSAALLWGVAVCLLCGCMSVGTTTDLKPKLEPSLNSSAGLFHVAGPIYAEAATADNPYARQLAEDYQRRLLPLVRRKCAAPGMPRGLPHPQDAAMLF